MDRGHVDRITRQYVTGWAADDASPESVMEVSVFVSGHKVAHVACDQPRTDLRSMGLYGGGRHGFRHTFLPPLPEDVPVKVTVRYTSSGRLLGHGEGILEPGRAEALVVPAQPHKDEQFVLPAPADPRMLFELLGLYDAKLGLYPLLCRLDFSNSRARRLEYSVFGEAGPPCRRSEAWNAVSGRDHLNDLLLSPGFQKNSLVYAMRAFPEKRRLLFVHIPKCAGSDLSFHLASRFPSLEQRLSDDAWTEGEQLFQALANFVREVKFSDSIFVRGHILLDYYVDNNLIRPIDRVFTIVRDPIDVALSQVNYVLTKMQLNIDAGVLEKDTEAWLRLLGLHSLPPEITPGFVREYSQKILYNTDIVQPNSLCGWLGGGDADAVIERLAHHQVEITDTQHYNAWLSREWGIAARTRQNESTKYVSLATCGHQDLVYLNELSPEDLKLYGAVQQALTIDERVSIIGEDLL